MIQGVDRKRAVRHRVHVHYFSHLALISDIPEKGNFVVAFCDFFWYTHNRQPDSCLYKKTYAFCVT
jgi:hypothetical protein